MNQIKAKGQDALAAQRRVRPLMNKRQQAVIAKRDQMWAFLREHRADLERIVEEFPIKGNDSALINKSLRAIICEIYYRQLSLIDGNSSEL